MAISTIEDLLKTKTYFAVDGQRIFSKRVERSEGGTRSAWISHQSCEWREWRAPDTPYRVWIENWYKYNILHSLNPRNDESISIPGDRPCLPELPGLRKALSRL